MRLTCNIIIIKRNISFSKCLLNNNFIKTPLKVFIETFRDEIKNSKDLKNDIKLLQDTSGRLADSDVFKKAKDALEKAHKTKVIAGRVAKKTATLVGDVALKAWDSNIAKEVRNTVKVSADVADKAFQPVRKTKIYKEVSNIIDDGTSHQYGGCLSKKKREMLREIDLKNKEKYAVKNKITINENAGTHLVLSEISINENFIKKNWNNFLSNPFINRTKHNFKNRWDESENGLVNFFKFFSNKISDFFAETEQAKVIRMLKIIDPSFTIFDFQRSLINYIIPDVLEAYIRNDEKVLKQWFGEVPYNLWKANNKLLVINGIFSDSKVLDIRGVEIVSCKKLQLNDLPVIVVSCRAQEIHLFKKIKTGELTAGSNNHILLSSYAIIFTRDTNDMINKITDGWKIIEFTKTSSRPFY